jgi:DNA invertase Pin-like site-specific DNA recombinase
MKVIWIISLIGGDMKIAVYLRVSTSDQSTEHQELSIAAWVAKQGYDLTNLEYYSDDGISGKNTKDRPSFTRLMADIAKGQLQKVLVFESSRASRDFLDYLKFLELCRSHNCQLEVIGQGPVEFSSSQDMLMASINAFLNQSEREKISERTKSGLAAAKARGTRLGAPKGNTYTRGRRKEFNLELVSDIMTLHQKNISMTEIAKLIGSKYSDTPLTYGIVQRIVTRHGKLAC